MPKPALSKISTAALTEEIQRRQRDLPKLQKERDDLAQRLEQLDRDIAGLSGVAPTAPAPAAAPAPSRRGAPKKKKAGRRSRPVNTESLNDALARVLSKDRPMTNQEAADAVLKAGYKTNSTNFRTIVTQVLSRDERFKAASRGQYVLA